VLVWRGRYTGLKDRVNMHSRKIEFIRSQWGRGVKKHNGTTEHGKSSSRVRAHASQVTAYPDTHMEHMSRFNVVLVSTIVSGNRANHNHHLDPALVKDIVIGCKRKPVWYFLSKCSLGAIDREGESPCRRTTA
jgi:hypothetical protein